MIILLFATVALVSADLQSVVSFQATGSGTFFVVCDGLSREIASVAELAVSRFFCLVLSGLFLSSLSFVSLSRMYLCFFLLCLSPPHVALSQFPSLFSLLYLSLFLSSPGLSCSVSLSFLSLSLFLSISLSLSPPALSPLSLPRLSPLLWSHSLPPAVRKCV